MKRVLAMLISVALVATLAVGGSIAYLTDTDEAVNVMVVGNVKIDQFEMERVIEKDANGNEKTVGMRPFTQGQKLYPAYYAGNDEVWQPSPGIDIYYGDYIEGAVGGNGLWQNMVGEMDKFVFVQNTGKSDCYYRTWIAIEEDETGMLNDFGQSMIHYNFNGHDNFEWVNEEKIGSIVLNGEKYTLMVAIHKEKLAPGEISRPSLLQVAMDRKADNDVVDGFGDEFKIYAFTQAVQADNLTEGYETLSATEKAKYTCVADFALAQAFGKIKEEDGTINHPWQNEDGSERLPADPVIVKTSEELCAAIEAAEPGVETVINLVDGDYTTNLKIAGGTDITITGGKNTVLSGQIATTSNAGTLTLSGVTVKVDDEIVDSTGISQTGKSAIAIWGNQTVICENVTFDMSLENSTAITSWWDTNEGTTIICRNCTFNCNGQRPIRATGNVTVENCTFNDPYRYAVQLTAKASTATELDKAVVNFKNNTIINGEHGKSFVYGLQLEGADYGCNDLVIYGSGNSIVNESKSTRSAGNFETNTMYFCECGKVKHATIEWNVTDGKPVHKEMKEVSGQDALEAALTAGQKDITLNQGTYTFPAGSLNADNTLICEPGTVFEGKSGANINGATVVGATFSNKGDTAVAGTVNGTFKDCTFDGSNGLRWCYAGETTVFENCTFSGDVYGVHFDGGANEAIFRNCTFSGFNAFGSAITKLTLENCTFVANGRSGYNGANLWGSTDLKNCTFIFDGSAEYEWVDCCSAGKVYNFENCVIKDATSERAMTHEDISCRNPESTEVNVK